MHRLFFALLLSLIAISSSRAGFWQLNDEDFGVESLRNVRVNYEEKWYRQQLDHFDRTNTQQWDQRYRVNSQFYSRGGPILILIGGESSTLSDYLLQKGLLFEIAEEQKGIMLHLEHRFYGLSHPTNDTSVDNLKYLSVDQGLADLATFTSWARSQYLGSKVFIHGGSYAGDMSAWFQLRYRHLVDGVFSASAPYHAEVDFTEYAQTIERVANAEAPGCYDRFAQGINMIEEKFKSDKAFLKSKFHLCDDLTTNLNDLYTLIDNMVSPFAGAIQYGDQDRNQPFNNAWEVCSNLTSETDPLEGLAKVNNIYMNGNKQSCLRTYDGLVDAMRNTSWQSDMVTSRGWVWQTCTEFGWYQTYTDGKAKPTTLLPLSYFLDFCSDVYGAEFGKQTFVQNNVDETNVYYGGYQLAANHTIIWNGDYDPWSRVSIRWPLTGANEVYVFNVAKNSHCTVMRAPVQADSAEAISVRRQIKEIFAKWMRPETSGGLSTLAASSKALIVTSVLFLLFA